MVYGFGFRDIRFRCRIYGLWFRVSGYVSAPLHAPAALLNPVPPRGSVVWGRVWGAGIWVQVRCVSRATVASGFGVREFGSGLGVCDARVGFGVWLQCSRYLYPSIKNPKPQTLSPEP